MTKSTLGVGLGAGLVSALLIAVIVRGTSMALLLYLLAPLPVVIVSLGWNHRAGLVSVATGALALALALSPLRGIAYAVATALPAWWLAYLALLGRPAADGSGRVEWYPLGRLLAWVAATAALSLAAVALLSAGDYATFREKSRAIVGAVVQMRSPDDEALAGGIIDGLALLVPALAAQGFALLLVLYLWAAGRIVRVSGRLPRPWPDLAGAAMPRSALGLLVLGGACAAVGGFVGVFGMALLGGLGTAFGLQGLAAVHHRTRGRPGRVLMLVGLYLVVFLSQGIALAVLALLALVETACGPRRGAAAST